MYLLLLGIVLTLLPKRVFSLANGYPLRIFPLGDSITYGQTSSDGNGYRQRLQSHLQNSGNSVTFFGSLSSGSMVNNQNEGHPSATIAQIASFGRTYLVNAACPNIMLIMAGTNDCNLFAANPEQAPDRLSSLLDDMYALCPQALLVVAQVTPINDPNNASKEPCIRTYNAGIPAVVDAKVSSGRKVQLVDMHSAVSVCSLIDGVHPNSCGWAFLAAEWFKALQRADAKGWIGPGSTLKRISDRVGVEEAVMDNIGNYTLSE